MESFAVEKYILHIMRCTFHMVERNMHLKLDTKFWFIELLHCDLHCDLHRDLNFHLMHTLRVHQFKTDSLEGDSL